MPPSLKAMIFGLVTSSFMPSVTLPSVSPETEEPGRMPGTSRSRSSTVAAVEVSSCSWPSTTTATGLAVRTVTVSPLLSFSEGAG